MPYGVSFIFGVNSVYTNILNEGIQRAVQSGFNIKFKHDVEWNVMRSATGKLLQVNEIIPFIRLNNFKNFRQT